MQKDILKKLLIEKINGLKEEIEVKNKDLKSYEEALVELDALPQKSYVTDLKNPPAPWAKIIMHYLSTVKKVGSAKEILDYAIVNYNLPADKYEDARNRIYSQIDAFKRKGKLKKTKNGNKITYSII